MTQRTVLQIAGALATTGGIELKADIEYGPERRLRMHVARKGDRRRRPAVSYIFGGGWRNGSPDQGLLGMIALAMRGFVAVCFDYRPSGEAIFPAQIEDCHAGLDYLRFHAEELALDPERIGLIGLSSGAHLAALLALQSTKGARGPGIAAVVDWCGPVDLLAMSEAQGSSHRADSTVGRLVGGPVADNADQAARANVLNYVHRDAPPFLILHGAKDRTVPLDQSVLLNNALLDAGARSELVVLPGVGHGFLGPRALLKTLSFLERELKTGARTGEGLTLETVAAER